MNRNIEVLPSSPLQFSKFASPVGELTLVADGEYLVAVLWPDEDPRRVVWAKTSNASASAVLSTATTQLQQYFAGVRRRFDIPLQLRGTDFQVTVWRGLQTIEYGSMFGYGQLAKQIGRPTASRAVGAANGRNPLSIVVPCHRVIGASGALTGFAGGIKTKQFLIEHEQRYLLDVRSKDRAK
jgi:methylated-DNA-[protein]-cysteine S-methyltransferase